MRDTASDVPPALAAQLRQLVYPSATPGDPVIALSGQVRDAMSARASQVPVSAQHQIVPMPQAPIASQVAHAMAQHPQPGPAQHAQYAAQHAHAHAPQMHAPQMQQGYAPQMQPGHAPQGYQPQPPAPAPSPAFATSDQLLARADGGVSFG